MCAIPGLFCLQSQCHWARLLTPQELWSSGLSPSICLYSYTSFSSVVWGKSKTHGVLTGFLGYVLYFFPCDLTNRIQLLCSCINCVGEKSNSSVAFFSMMKMKWQLKNNFSFSPKNLWQNGMTFSTINKGKTKTKCQKHLEESETVLHSFWKLIMKKWQNHD